MRTPNLAISEADSMNPDRVREQLAAGADPNTPDEHGLTPLFHANHATAQVLIDSGADVNARNRLGETPLHGSESVFLDRVLIDAGADVNVKNEQGQTRLHRVSNPEGTRALIDAGADVNSADNNGDTPLHAFMRDPSAADGYDDAVLALIGAGAERFAKNQAGESVDDLLSPSVREAFIAFETGGAEALEGFFDKSPLLDALDRNDVQAFQEGVAKKLDAGHDLNDVAYQLDHQGAFFKAASPEAVHALLEMGADPDVVNERGQTPLVMACETGKVDVVKALAQSGASLTWADSEDKTPLRAAVRYGLDGKGGSVEMMEILLGAGAPMEPTLLHDAASYRNRPAIETLVNRGADLEARDRYGRTPLFQSGDGETGRFLVTLGADIHARDKAGHAPTDEGQTTHGFRLKTAQFQRHLKESFAKHHEGVSQRSASESPSMVIAGKAWDPKTEAEAQTQSSTDAQSVHRPRHRL